MKKNDVKDFRMNMGKFLHNYYLRFGEEKYEKFLEELGPTLEAEFGEAFSSDNMRIMEAEFVTFSSKLNNKYKDEKQNKKSTSR